MDLEEFKKDFIRKELKITENYGKIFSFIDFSNVNKWFENDNQDWNNKLLDDSEKISSADLIINAQNIKKHIAKIEKQRPD